MIVKPPPSEPDHSSLGGVRKQAGMCSEAQMAFYLHRAFERSETVFVLNDLKLEDRMHPNRDGTPSVCQIDHLVIHRYGMFIVESKSVSEKVRVCSDGSGGDEWTRFHGGSEKGMPSPIRQAERQALVLRDMLIPHRARFLRGVPFLLDWVLKKLGGNWGLRSAHFQGMPVQIVVAISDDGMIERGDGWEAPRKPFPVYVAKADLVVGKIRLEITRHERAFIRAFFKPLSPYGMWKIDVSKGRRIAEFLARNDCRTERSTADCLCRYCHSASLRPKWGRYGYYWKCMECSGNTPMPLTCSRCGIKGYRGKRVRIRKDGKRYIRQCVECDFEEPFYEDRGDGSRI